MNCPECKAQIIQQDKFCPKCGHKIDWIVVNENQSEVKSYKNAIVDKYRVYVRKKPEIEALILIISVIAVILIIWGMISGWFLTAPHGKYYYYTKINDEYKYEDSYLDFEFGGTVKWYDREGNYEIAQYDVNNKIVTIEGDFLYGNFYGGKLRLKWDKFSNELRQNNKDGFKKRM